MTTTVFVEGESGIGKSALVRSFIERIEPQRRGVLVLAGRCYERESVPFKGIDGVVDSLARELARRTPAEVARHLSNEVEALSRVFPVLRRVAPIARMSVPRPASPVELRARAFRGLRMLLSSLATDGTARHRDRRSAVGGRRLDLAASRDRPSPERHRASSS